MIIVRPVPRPRRGVSVLPAGPQRLQQPLLRHLLLHAAQGLSTVVPAPQVSNRNKSKNRDPKFFSNYTKLPKMRLHFPNSVFASIISQMRPHVFHGAEDHPHSLTVGNIFFPKPFIYRNILRSSAIMLCFKLLCSYFFLNIFNSFNIFFPMRRQNYK